MSNEGSTKGWAYEPADPTMGRYTGEVYHEDCDAWDEENGYHAGVTETRDKVSCDGCGAFFYQPEPDYELMAEMSGRRY